MSELSSQRLQRAQELGLVSVRHANVLHVKLLNLAEKRHLVDAWRGGRGKGGGGGGGG